MEPNVWGRGAEGKARAENKENAGRRRREAVTVIGVRNGVQVRTPDCLVLAGNKMLHLPETQFTHHGGFSLGNLLDSVIYILSCKYDSLLAEK